MIWGTISDHIGRRPISAICLLILSLSCVGLALVPTSAYWLLMILRCLQAAGSASTIAIGNIYLCPTLLLWMPALGAGVIGDISNREERAGFFGLFMLGPMVNWKQKKNWSYLMQSLSIQKQIGPSIGPILGGALSDSLGWRFARRFFDQLNMRFILL